MKRTLALAAIAACSMLGAHALDLVTECAASSFGLTADGGFDPAVIRYGEYFEVSDRLSPNLFGKLAYDGDPVNGNLLSARAMYRTSYLEIAAGPSFGVLNSTGAAGAIPVLFQPGLGLGFKVTAPGIVVATADTEFALPPAVFNDGQVFLQKSELSAGFFLPNVLCTLKVSQRTNSAVDGTASKTGSTTDYGFYTTAYKKGSIFRVSTNFIYRVLAYRVTDDSSSDLTIGNLVLGAGLICSPKAEYSIFVDGDGSLYSFSLGAPMTGLDRFMFNLRAGVSLSLSSPGGD